MNGLAYYNEHDPFAAAWLRELIRAGHIAPGDVDERSIKDVTPNDIKPYTQCHFFAGIGGWSYALRLAGWPDDRPVWTGSCPCQSFSAAGGRAGFKDERHLWPDFHWLIEQCRPDWIFGEQVASSDALAWLDLVCADLEGTGYTARAIDMCAAGFGAPHIRQRLYWVADSKYSERWPEREIISEAYGRNGLGRCSDVSGLANNELPQSPRFRSDCRESVSEQETERSTGNRGFGGLVDSNQSSHNERSSSREQPLCVGHSGASDLDTGRRPGATNGAWADADWLFCRDDKWRAVRSGTFPLAHGVSNRMGKLRGYGNAIVPQEAAFFVESVMKDELEKLCANPK